MTATSRKAAVSSSDNVASQLREAIMKGDLSPNERLIEVDLAEMFGTNRANVRTALAKIEQEGLVVRELNRGARVRSVSGAEALEIAEIRSLVEVMVAKHAAAKCTPDDKAILQDIGARMKQAFATEDFLKMSGLNEQLHQEIQRIAGHGTATGILQGLKSKVVRKQYRAIFVPGRAERSLAEHSRVIAAISANDPEAAGAAMTEHMENVAQALKTSISFSLGSR
ncbi:GntR family transcriptional regulator [Terrihabitans soli]|nr:GntR family transcriptional regulator [Terrihabitans soli]